jgi:hypothetical protein
VKANLHPDGSLALQTERGTQVIRPHHPQYASMMKLYADQRARQSPVALSASQPTDYAELAEAIADQWNRQQEGGEPVTHRQMQDAAAMLAPGTFQVARSAAIGDDWHAWPVHEVDDDGERIAPAALSLSAAAVDEAAAQTADPSLAQRRSGNYRKGRCELHGLPIVIETARGHIRGGTDHQSKPWLTVLAHHYGYLALPGLASEADYDHVDVFIGPDPASEMAFVVDQLDHEGSWEEHKVLLGFRTEAEARQAYLDAYEPGWNRLGSITAMSVGELKLWLEQGDTSSPMSEQAVALSAGSCGTAGYRSEVRPEVRAEAVRLLREKLAKDFPLTDLA